MWRRWSANAPCIRRVLPWPVRFVASFGLARVLLWTAALTRLTTANTYSRSLQSRVPTVGRCPLTPSVAVRVGTIGKRASSWLNSTSSPARAFFKPGQVRVGLSLLGRVAAQQAVGGAVGPHAELLAEAQHGRAAGPDARGLVQVVGQLGVGPVGSVQAAGGRPVEDPAADRVGQGGRDLGCRALSLSGRQAVQAPLQVGVEPAGHGA